MNPSLLELYQVKFGDAMVKYFNVMAERVIVKKSTSPKDRSGRELKSFHYMAIDEKRGPCHPTMQR